VKELKEALDCVKTMKKAHADAPRDGSSVSMTQTEAVANTEAVAVEKAESTMDNWWWLRQAKDAVFQFLGRLLPCLLCDDLADESPPEDTWEYVCKLGGKVWKFILDTTEKICEGITWVSGCLGTRSQPQALC
jgi:hypothetical protein